MGRAAEGEGRERGRRREVERGRVEEEGGGARGRRGESHARDTGNNTSPDHQVPPHQGVLAYYFYTSACFYIS